MANSKSAEKRIKINKRNYLQNKYYKTSVRTLMKRFYTTLELYKNSPSTSEKENLETLVTSIYSMLDKGTKKKIFHKNAAARKKAKVTSYLKAI